MCIYIIYIYICICIYIYIYIYTYIYYISNIRNQQQMSRGNHDASFCCLYFAFLWHITPKLYQEKVLQKADA